MKKITIFIATILLAIPIFAQNGSIKGKVTDESNNEPIPFATIVVEDTQIFTTSDFDGNFIITGLESGYTNLEVSFIGYEKFLSQDILVSKSKTPYVELKLTPTDQTIGEVKVTADRFKKDDNAPLSKQSIGIREIESNPGSNRDISRVIQSFPGVGSTPAFRNDIIIRGGSPSENRFFLDGVEIPILNHFATQGASGGPVGIINADFISSVDYYSGSFPASKYNAVSAFFDFKLKEGNMEKANFQAAVGASETSFTVDGPIGKNTSYIMSVRRSYLQFLFSAIGLPFLPTFNDYQFKIKSNLSPKDQLTIISLGSLDQMTINTGIENPDESQQYILSQINVNNQWSYTLGGVYKHFTNNGYHTFVLSRNMLNNELYKYPDNDETQEKTFDLVSFEAENKARYEYTHLWNGYRFNFGAGGEYARYSNKSKQILLINDNLVDYQFSSELDFFKYGAFGQVSKRYFNENLLLSLGVRSDAATYNDNMNNLLDQVSPRFSASYSLPWTSSINFGVGRYFQMPAYTTLGYKNDDDFVNKNSAKFIGANHLNLGVDKKFGKKVFFSVEGFYKDYFQYPVDTITGASLANGGAGYGVAGASPVEFVGKGRAVGVEVLNRLNFKNLKFIASYTFVRSEFSGLDSDELIPSAWDSQHLLTITGTQDFKYNWRMGFKWRFVGGLPYTPYDLETSAFIPAWNAIGTAYLDYDQLNTERFNAFHQLDVRIDKNFFFNKWSLMVYFDIQNAYNFKNEGQDFIVRELNEDGSYKITEDGQNYVLKRVPNKSGTVLPTLGLMVKF